MKIICIGQNYTQHIKELGHKPSTEPLFFMKPDTAVLRNNDPFYIPEFTKELHYETELVVKINRVVKSISKEFASRCYNEVAVGIDFTARDIQRRCIEDGRPWEVAKSFDKSAPIPNNFITLEELGKDIADVNFRLDIDGTCVQRGYSGNMLFGVDEIIAYCSQFVTLKIGDLIFTGTPAGVGAVAEGNRLQAYLEDNLMLDFEIK